MTVNNPIWRSHKSSFNQITHITESQKHSNYVLNPSQIILINYNKTSLEEQLINRMFKWTTEDPYNKIGIS